MEPQLCGNLGARVLKLLLLPLFALADGDEVIDLGEMGADAFTPYLVERNPIWMLLPAAALLLVILHLRRNKKRRIR